ncbi:linear amide C-N hydrolase [Weissella hellenica]|nr:linear amide C-N hydrolase [Weissella hellenica]
MCTSILQIAKDGTHVLSRTMDWPKLENSPMFVPRKYRWHSSFNRHLIQNKYAFIGGGELSSKRTDIADGVNEFGLSAQKLTFGNGAKFVDNIDDEKVQIAPFEFVFWLLGNFKSVDDMVSHIDQIQLMSDQNSVIKYGNPELHYAVTDTTGAIVVVEPTTWPMKIVANPLGIVTNSPYFNQQIKQLEKYVEFKPEFKAGTIGINVPKVTTGKLSGKSTPPGAYSPGARFLRAAYLKERADQPNDENEAIITSWHLLDSVTVPQNLRHQQTFSVYRAATVSESRSYYFQSYHQGSITKLQLTDEMLTLTEPIIYEVPDELSVNQLN